MVTNFAKFARTNKSLVVFSNSFDHIELFKRFYKDRVKPNEFGFIKINGDKICLLHEDLKCDLIQGKTNELKREALLDIFMQESKYIITSSKFIIFPKKFTYKRVAQRLFRDYIIQGAGEVIFEKTQNGVEVSCFGESIYLNVKSRAIDSLIIKDELESLFDED
ncbi:hypothetical protein [Arcobacter porcinus]|uniref:Uncharacterized protein n=1 Tax=Arcobacter porcinus TaxID=1935204 RepID=A0A1C0AVN1_9BACT|nr:hypothetical protein [Arcobacter porcinus]OCL85421.1 hypothetical protein AAX30_01923 [Arcobacter porcinus]OCL90642.1 hypothetical protein AAX27_01451 [Aliarcobacter thereius]OCL90786.1 hypothetical protein AAX28_01603 [Arcobacter porcinus]QEP40800.1 hypothetical protein APORC_1202 [Arcobacter porcinus]